MRPWIKWLLVAAFLIAMGVIQFIPDPAQTGEESEVPTGAATAHE